MDKIDINQPVKQGSDVILNYSDGSQRLGSPSGFNREARRDVLLKSAMPPNDNPRGDVNPGDQYGGTTPVDEAKVRAAHLAPVEAATEEPVTATRQSNGRFAKK